MKNFWNKIEMIPEHSCWEWVGYKDKDGYGRLKTNQRDLRAHRLSYELHKGVIPIGKLICHMCDNTSCVNPNHLFLGTRLDNSRDCIKKGRHPNRSKNLIRYSGEKNAAAKLTKLQVDTIRFFYSQGDYSQQRLADLYNVSQALISFILLQKIWK